MLSTPKSEPNLSSRPPLSAILFTDCEAPNVIAQWKFIASGNFLIIVANPHQGGICVSAGKISRSSVRISRALAKIGELDHIRGRLRDRALFVVFALACIPAQAPAAVEISFLSKEFGSSFPHAYVVLEGNLDRGGERIRANYGFTAVNVSPAVLMGSVKGEVMSVDAAYMRSSDRHFTITLSDAEYDRVMVTVERWRTLQQPSYNLNRQNCVFFVAHVAAALGMKADTPASLMKKPRSYLEMLGRANSAWLEARGARLLR